MADLRLRIRAENQASAPIQNLKREITDLGGEVRKTSTASNAATVSIDKLGTEAQQAAAQFDNFGDEVRQSGERLRDARGRFVSTGQDATKFGGAVSGAGRGVSRFSGLLGGLGGVLGALGLASVTSQIGEFATSSVRAAAQLEGFERGLMLIEGTNAPQRLEELIEVANLPGLNLTDLINYSNRLRSIGLTGEEVDTILQSTGQTIVAMGGTAATAAEATEQLVQALQNNTVSLQDFRSIAQRVPGFYQAIADVHDVEANIDGFRVAVDRAGGSVKDALLPVMDELANRFGSPPADSYVVAVDSLQNSFFLLQAEIGERLLPVVAQAAGQLANFFDGLRTGTVDIPQPLTEIFDRIKGLATAIFDLGRNIVEFVLPHVQRFYEGIGELASSILNLAQKILPLLAPLFEIVKVSIAATYEIVGQLASAIADVIDGIASVVDWLTFWESAEENVTASTEDLAKSVDVAEAAIRTVSTTFSDTMKATEAYQAAIKALSSEFDENEKSITRLTASQQRHLDAGGVRAASAYQATEKQLNNLRARQDELTSALDVTTQKLGETTGALMTAGDATEGAGNASGNYQLRLAMLTEEAEDAREVLSNTIDTAQVSANFQEAAQASDAYYQAQIDNAEAALAREVEGSEEAQKLEVDLFNLRREQQEARADLYQEASEVFIEEENRQAKEAERVAEVREQVAEQTAKNIQQSEEEANEARRQSIEDFNTTYEALTKDRESAEQAANENIVRLSESALSEIEDRFKNALPDAVAEAYQAVQSATVQHYETLKDQARQRITDEDELNAELTLLDTQRNAQLRENHREYLSQLASDAKELLGERTEAFEAASSDILNDWNIKLRGFEDRLKDVDTQEGLDTLRSDFETAQEDMLSSLETVLEGIGFSATEIATIMQGFYQDAEQEAARFQGKVGDVQEEITEGNVAIQTSSDAAADALKRIGIETEDDLKNADANTKNLAESILEVQESIDRGLILSIDDLSLALEQELIPGLTSTEAALQKAFVDTLPYLDTFLQGIQDLGTEIGFLGEETADAVGSLQDVFSAIGTGDVLGFFTSIPGLVQSLNALTVEGFEAFGHLEALTDLSGEIADTDELTGGQQQILQTGIDNIINEIAVRTIESAGPGLFHSLNEQITSFLGEAGFDFDFDEAVESLEQLGVLTNDYNEAVGDTTIEFVKGFEDALDAGFGIPDLLENFDLFVNQPVTIGRPDLGGRTAGGGVAGESAADSIFQPLNDIFSRVIRELGFDPNDFRLDTTTGHIVSLKEAGQDLVTLLGSGVGQIAELLGITTEEVVALLDGTATDIDNSTDNIDMTSVGMAAQRSSSSVRRYVASHQSLFRGLGHDVQTAENQFTALNRSDDTTLEDVYDAYENLIAAEVAEYQAQIRLIDEAESQGIFSQEELAQERSNYLKELNNDIFTVNGRLATALRNIGLELVQGFDSTSNILSGSALAVQNITENVEMASEQTEEAVMEAGQSAEEVVGTLLKTVFRFTQEQRDALSASAGNITRAENEIRALGDDATAEQVISAYAGLRDAEQTYHEQQLQFIDAGIGTFTDDALSNARIRIANELEDTAFDANQRLIRQLEDLGFTLTTSISATTGFLDNTTLGFERISDIVEPATQNIDTATEETGAVVDEALRSVFRFTQEQRDVLSTLAGSITRAENEIRALGDDATAEQVISAYAGLRDAEQTYHEQQLMFIDAGVGTFTDDALSNARVRVANELEDTAFDANQRLLSELEDLGFTLTTSITATTGFLSDTALTIEAIPEAVEAATGEAEQSAEEVVEGVDEALKSVFRFTQEQNDVLKTLAGQITTAENTVKSLGDDSSVPQIILAYRALRDAETAYYDQQLDFISAGVGVFSDDALARARTRAGDQLNDTAFDANQRFLSQLEGFGFTLTTSISATSGFLSDTALAFEQIPEMVEPASDEIKQTTEEVVEGVDEALKSVFRFTQEQRDTLSTLAGNITRAENEIRALGDDATAEQVISAYQGLRSAEQTYHEQQLQFIDAGIGTFTDDALSNARMRFLNELEGTAFDANQRLLRELEDIGFTLTTSITATTGFLTDAQLQVQDIPEEVGKAVDSVVREEFRFTEAQQRGFTTLRQRIQIARQEIDRLVDNPDITPEELLDAYRELSDAETELYNARIKTINDSAEGFTDTAITNELIQQQIDFEGAAHNFNEQFAGYFRRLGLQFSTSIFSITGFFSEDNLGLEQIPEEVEEGTSQVATASDEASRIVSDATKAILRYVNSFTGALGVLEGAISEGRDAFEALTFRDDETLDDVLAAYQKLTDAEQEYYNQQIAFIERGIAEGIFSEEDAVQARSIFLSDLRGSVFSANEELVDALKALGLELVTSVDETTGILTGTSIAVRNISTGEVSDLAGNIVDEAEAVLDESFRFTSAQNESFTTLRVRINRARRGIEMLGDDASPEQLLEAYRELRDAETALFNEKVRVINESSEGLTDTAITNELLRQLDNLENTAQSVNTEFASLFANLGLRIEGTFAGVDTFFNDTQLVLEEIPSELQSIADSARRSFEGLTPDAIRAEIDRLKFELGGALNAQDFESIRSSIASAIQALFDASVSELRASSATGVAFDTALSGLDLDRRRDLVSLSNISNVYSEADQEYFNEAIRIAQELQVELADIESQSFTRRVEMAQDQVEVVEEAAEEQIGIVEEASSEIQSISSGAADDRRKIEAELAQTIQEINDKAQEDQLRAESEQSDKLTDIQNDYAQEISRINIDLTDSLEDLGRDQIQAEREKLEQIEDLNRDHVQSLEDLKEQSNRRIEDIELDLQRRIEDINRDAEQNIAELEDDPSLGARTNARRRQEAIAEIRRDAQQSIAEAQRRAGRSREDVAIDEQRNIDDLEEQRVERLAELERQAAERLEELRDSRLQARSQAQRQQAEAQANAEDARAEAQRQQAEAHAQAVADIEDQRAQAQQEAIDAATEKRIALQEESVQSQQSSISSASQQRQTERQQSEVAFVEDLGAKQAAQDAARQKAQERLAEAQNKRNEAFAEQQAAAALINQTKVNESAEESTESQNMQAIETQETVNVSAETSQETQSQAAIDTQESVNESAEMSQGMQNESAVETQETVNTSAEESQATREELALENARAVEEIHDLAFTERSGYLLNDFTPQLEGMRDDRQLQRLTDYRNFVILGEDIQDDRQTQRVMDLLASVTETEDLSDSRQAIRLASYLDGITAAEDLQDSRHMMRVNSLLSAAMQFQDAISMATMIPPIQVEHSYNDVPVGQGRGSPPANGGGRPVTINVQPSLKIGDQEVKQIERQRIRIDDQGRIG